MEKRSSLKSRRYSSSSTTMIAPMTGPTSVPLPPARTMMIMEIMKEKPNTSGPTKDDVVGVEAAREARDAGREYKSQEPEVEIGEMPIDWATKRFSRTAIAARPIFE